MAATLEQMNLLDQLQQEVNRVLEQIGRVFAALANKDSRDRSLAQASRLKHTLPDSVRRFHEALDGLDSELQLAKLVTRRDLAKCASSAADAAETIDDLSNPMISETQGSTDLVSQPEQGPKDVAGDLGVSEATGAADLTIDVPVFPEKLPSLDVQEVEHANKSGPVHPHDSASTADPAPTKLVVDNDGIDQTAPVAQQAMASGPNAESNDSDIPPDTAISTNADLESLFGPASASGAQIADDLENQADETDSFNFNFVDNDASGGMDDMTHDGNEIFLPGLQDYANAEPEEGGNANSAELDALLSDFAAGSADHKANGDQQNGGGDGGANFDDLLDFEDLAAGFDASAENGATGDFNFDFS